MRLRDLSIWDGVLIATKDKDDKKINFNSKVVEYHADGIFIIAPAMGEVRAGLAKGQSVSLVNSSHGDVVEWKCIFHGLQQLENVKVYKLSCDTQGKVVNRRETYRVPFINYMEFTRNDDKFTKLRGMINDLSYEGVGINAMTIMNIGDYIQFNLSWEQYDMDIEAKIIRKDKIGDDRGYKYGAVITSKDESVMSKLIYDIQIKSLRKGK